MVQSYAKKYSNALVKNIDRFPPETLNVLDAFSIFNVENMPGVESYVFQMYCSREINVLADNYYVNNDVKKDALEKEFDSFKFELIELKKKWNSFKDNIKSNKLKLKCTATEWGLRTIVHDFGETSEYPLISEMAWVALITPVSNAWPERGANAVKWIKSCLRSTMGKRCVAKSSAHNFKWPRFGYPTSGWTNRKNSLKLRVSEARLQEATKTEY